MDSGMWQTISKAVFLKKITRMIIVNIVMLVTRLSIVDWVYFKTQTLLTTLRTQNLLFEESYVSSEAEHLSPSFDSDVPNRLTDQMRLSIYNWNPGPRRGKEDAIEKHIAAKWHIITLQESFENLDHDYFANRFFVIHYGGCAVLFNKETFHPEIKVSSVSSMILETCNTRWWTKDNQDGFYTVSSHVQHFGGRHATASRSLLWCRYTSTTSLPRSAVSGKSSYLQSVRWCWRSSWIWLLATSAALPGAAHAATIENSPVLLKKPSPIRAYLCQVAPHHCEDQVRCRVNGLMCVGWSSHWTLMISGRFAYTVRSLSPTTPRVLVKRIKAAHLALANPRGDYAPQYHHDERLHLKERSSPYILNKERTRAHQGTKRPFAQLIGHPFDQYVLPWAQCERPAQQRVHQGPSSNDLMRHRAVFSLFCCFSVIRVTPCIHVTSHVAPHPLICLDFLRKKETNISIPQFYRIWNHFFGCWIVHGWNTCSRPLGLGSWSATFNQRHCKTW